MDVAAAQALGLYEDQTLDELDDIELLVLTRAGHQDSYAVLYDRYLYAARRLARHLGQREESDDVVSEAFAQVFDLLQRGKGPDRAFRAYLFTTIRHESGRRAKANQRVMPTDDEAKIDSVVPFGAGELDAFERNAIRAAYESLPERWRTVLWHLDVEGLKPNEIAPLLGLKPNSVSALVYRARSGLRDAYLQQHVSTSGDAEPGVCGDVRKLLAGVVRRTATMRDQEKVHAHLETCDDCVAVYVDLQEVNRDVGTIVVPAAVAVSVVGGAGALATVSGGAVFAHLFAGAKSMFLATAGTAAAAVATATVMTSVPEPATAGPAPAQVRTTPSAPAAPSTVTATPGPGQTTATVEEPSSSSPAKVATVDPATAPAAVVPTAPAPVAVDAGIAKVTVGGGAVEVTAGPLTVSTEPVTKALGKVAPTTTGVVTQLLGGASAR